MCVAIFAGDRGHRDEVLSIDVHLSGACFVSSGMDNTVKVWSLQRETVQAAVRDSYAQPTRTDQRPFQTCYEQFPVFATSKVHNNYVDCVAWLGSLLCSKSTAHKVALWKPDPRRRRDAVLVLHECVVCSRARKRTLH